MFMNLCLSALAFEIVARLTKVKTQWNKSSFSRCGFQISGYPIHVETKPCTVVPYIVGGIKKNTGCPPIDCSYRVYFSSYILSFSLLDGKTTQPVFIESPWSIFLKSNGHECGSYHSAGDIASSPHYDWFNTV